MHRLIKMSSVCGALMVALLALVDMSSPALAQCSGLPSGNTICASPSGGGGGFPAFRLMVPADVPAGVVTNAAVSVTGTMSINGSTFCGPRIYAGGTAYYTLTISAASNFPSPCVITVTDTDTGRGKLVAVTGGTNCRLWPGQTATFVVNNGATTSFCPGLWTPPSSITLNVDPVNGSNTNDCLATGTGNACQTFNGAMAYIAGQINNINGVTILSAASQTYTDAGLTAQGYTGGGCVTVDGNSSTIAIVSGFANILLNKVNGCWQVRRWTLTNAQTGGIGLYAQQMQNVIILDGMNFGSGTSSVAISSIGSWIHCSNNFTISGSWQSWISQIDFGKVECSNITVTLTGTPNWSSAGIVSHGAGAIVDVGSNTYSGSATGQQCSANLLGLIDTSGGFASLPGNSACTVQSGAVIN